MTKLQEHITAAKAGTKEAFDELLGEYFAPLYRYVYFRVGSAQAAEKIVPEVFADMVASCSVETSTPRDPMFQMMTFARRAVDAHLAEQSSREQPKDSEEEPHAPGDIRPADLAKAMASLSPSEQEIVIHRFINGRTDEETSRHMVRSEESVRRLSAQALVKLRDVLLHYGHEL